MRNPFRYFNSLPEVIRLTVTLYIRYPLSLPSKELMMQALGVWNDPGLPGLDIPQRLKSYLQQS